MERFICERRSPLAVSEPKGIPVTKRFVMFATSVVLITGSVASAKSESPSDYADSGEGGQAFHLKADSESGRWRTAFR